MLEWERLFVTARMGFTVVPFMMRHPEHGTCQVELDGKGIRVKALRSAYENYATWEEIDAEATK